MKIAGAVLILMVAVVLAGGLVYITHADIATGMLIGVVVGIAAIPPCCYLLEDYF